MSIFKEEDCHILVQSSLNIKDFEFVDCTSKRKEDSVIAILSDYNVFKISVRLKTGVLSELSFVVKSIPEKPEARLEFVTKVRAFYKEPVLYNTLLKDISLGESKLGPLCHLARVDDVIVLEDLYGLGYRRMKVRKEFDLQHCELTLEALAKLHAKSLILEETKSAKLTELYPGLLFETIFSDDIEHVGFHFMCTAINALESIIGTYFSHFSPAICKDAVALLRNLPFFLKPSVNFRNVFCHGNLYGSNILFSHNLDNQPNDIRFVNFSSSRYAPPASDVLTFLHCTTSRAFREIHQGSLLTLYYSNLAKELQKKQLDLRQLIPWSDFEASCEHYIATALAAALMNLHFILLPDETMSSILSNSENWNKFIFEDRNEIIQNAYCIDEVYRKRLSQVLIQTLDYCQFKQTRKNSIQI